MTPVVYWRRGGNYMMRNGATLVLGAVLALGACGGDDDDDMGMPDGTPDSMQGMADDPAALQGLLGSHGLVHSTMFTVAPGATGLPGTAVAEAAPNAHSHLFRSDRKGPSHIAGDNQLLAGPADLDLGDADPLDAVSTVHQLGTHSPYYFSVKDVDAVDEGRIGSAVRAESTAAEVGGDVFYAAGFGNEAVPGRNYLFTDEVRLGMQPVEDGATPKDDLSALDFFYGTTPGLIYFSVGRTAVGIEAVAAVAEAERPCTIFRTMLGSGTVEVAYTCANLGLEAGDDVDALMVRGTSVASAIYFSVDAASQGAVGTAVRTESTGGAAEGDIFYSAGTGMNAVHVPEAGLALQSAGAPDEVDALTVADLTLEGYVTRLPPPPEDPPPYADPPPTGADPGDSEGFTPAWEIAVLGSPPNVTDYDGSTTVAHPCTTCNITPTVPADHVVIDATRMTYGPIIDAVALFGYDGPLAGSGNRVPLGPDGEPILVVRGDCFNQYQPCGPTDTACPYYISVMTTRGPPDVASGDKLERVCGLHLRDEAYSSPAFPRDLFTNSTVIMAQRFQSGSWAPAVFDVGSPQSESITAIDAGSCFLAGGATSVGFLNAYDLQTIGASAPIPFDEPHPYRCFAFEATDADPFGTSTGNYGLSTSPQGDAFYYGPDLSTFAFCGAMQEPTESSFMVYGAGFSDQYSLSTTSPLVNFEGCQ